MPLTQGLKAAVKRLPGIAPLLDQRNQLRWQLDAQLASSAALQQELDRVNRGLAEQQRQLADQAQQIASQARQLGELNGQDAPLQAELTALRQACGFVPPGHYYSPIPDLAEVRRDEARIFSDAPPRQLPGLDMREAEQLALLQQLRPYYDSQPFGEQPREGLRYHFDNPSYAYSDGVLLHCMLRHLKPRRLIEVGSGFSSCVTLDTNELFLDGALQTTFIEPYPALLKSLLRPGDAAAVTIHEQRLQDVDLALFGSLQSGDVLFIDSTHVSRVGSDVNRVVFDILPALAPGVVIHVHDMFWPFEYPKEWIYFGRAWNELYLMRAFLQHNSAFQVLLMNTFMDTFHRPFFEQHMPLCTKNPGGSLWLRKTG